jgi:hypothetical protein
VVRCVRDIVYTVCIACFFEAFAEKPRPAGNALHRVFRREFASWTKIRLPTSEIVRAHWQGSGPSTLMQATVPSGTMLLNVWRRSVVK